jgi:signal recognition particle GTPase
VSTQKGEKSVWRGREEEEEEEEEAEVVVKETEEEEEEDEDEEEVEREEESDCRALSRFRSKLSRSSSSFFVKEVGEEEGEEAPQSSEAEPTPQSSTTVDFGVGSKEEEGLTSGISGNCNRIATQLQKGSACEEKSGEEGI